MTSMGLPAINSLSTAGFNDNVGSLGEEKRLERHLPKAVMRSAPPPQELHSYSGDMVIESYYLSNENKAEKWQKRQIRVRQ